MASTALRASTQSANNTHMVFMDEEHERLEIEVIISRCEGHQYAFEIHQYIHETHP